MKISVVVDNSVPIKARKPFRAEHGASFLIEYEGRKILFDTGQSDIVLHNLSLMGIHPSALDAIVLSHGHHDHCNGLPFVLRHRQSPIPVYAHPGVFTPRYSVGDSRRFAGVSFRQEDMAALGAEWRLCAGIQEIAPGLIVSGHVERTTEFETGDTRLVLVDENGCDCQDRIEDDLSMFFTSPKGLVVIGGCAHSGLVNTVRQGFRLTGQEKLAGWIGGTHLGPVSGEQREKTLAWLASCAPGFVAANHCTGFDMMCELQRRFGSRFIPGFVGAFVEC